MERLVSGMVHIQMLNTSLLVLEQGSRFEKSRGYVDKYMQWIGRGQSFLTDMTGIHYLFYVGGELIKATKNC